MKKILFLIFILLAGQSTASTTWLIDTMTDTNGVHMHDHSPDTNNTGHSYTSLNALSLETRATIQSNKCSVLSTAAADRPYPKFYLNLGSAATSGKITYTYTATSPNNITEGLRFNIASSHTAESSGASCTGYAVVMRNNTGTSLVRLYGNTNNAFGLLKASATFGSGTGSCDIKVTWDGNSILVYADESGGATTVRIYWPTTLNSANTEIAVYGSQDTDAVNTIDSLNIVQDILATNTPTVTPIITPTDTPVISPTATPTDTSTFTETPTITESPTITETPTISPTYTITLTPTITPTPFPGTNRWQKYIWREWLWNK